jgi:hypothetical protein
MSAYKINCGVSIRAPIEGKSANPTETIKADLVERLYVYRARHLDIIDTHVFKHINSDEFCITLLVDADISITDPNKLVRGLLTDISNHFWIGSPELVSQEMQDRICNNTYELGELVGLVGGGAPKTSFIVKNLVTRTTGLRIQIAAFDTVEKTALAILDHVRNMGEEYVLAKTIDPSRDGKGLALINDSRAAVEENCDFTLSPFHASAYVTIGNAQIWMRRDRQGVIRLEVTPRTSGVDHSSEAVLSDKSFDPEDIYELLAEEEWERLNDQPHDQEEIDASPGLTQ